MILILNILNICGLFSSLFNSLPSAASADRFVDPLRFIHTFRMLLITRPLSDLVPANVSSEARGTGRARTPEPSRRSTSRLARQTNRRRREKTRSQEDTERDDGDRRTPAPPPPPPSRASTAESSSGPGSQIWLKNASDTWETSPAFSILIILIIRGPFSAILQICVPLRHLRIDSSYFPISLRRNWNGKLLTTSAISTCDRYFSFSTFVTISLTVGPS